MDVESEISCSGGGIFLGSTHRIFGTLSVFCLMMILWREWNSFTFENVESSMSQLESLVIRTFFYWSCAWGLTNSNCLL